MYSFKEIIDAKRKELSPLDILLKELCLITGRQIKTIKMWYYGTQFPPTREMNILEEYFGLPAKVLFPNKKEYEKKSSKPPIQ